MKIFVTGIQRGGTHFLADYLAKKYKLKYIEEREFFNHDLNKLDELIEEDCVIQCPCLKDNIPKIKKLYPDSIVIWMHRDVVECVESMTKVNWQKSAIAEADRLQNKIPLCHSQNFFESIVLTSLELGFIYFKQGYVDFLINMKSLEGLEGFKKNQGVIGLK